jgi:alpha-1,2-mannosyltransferase
VFLYARQVTGASPVGDHLRAAWRRDDAGSVPGLIGRAIAVSSVCALAAIAATIAFPELLTFGEHPEHALWTASVAFTLLFLGFRRLARGELGAYQIVTLVAGLALIGLARQIDAATWDYTCYADAGRALTEGRDLYAWAHGEPTLGGTRYLYSPLLANLFALLERIPDHHLGDTPAYLVWTAVVYWAACACVPLLLRVLHAVYGVPFVVATGAALLLGTVSTPVLRTMVYSQPNALVADCLFGWLLLSRTRETRGAGLLALAVVLKTSPVVFLALPLAERRWRALAAAVGWCAAIVALSMASTGAGPWIAFLKAAPQIRTMGLHRDNSFASLLYACGKLLGIQSEAAAHVGGLLLGIGLLLAFALRTKARWPWTTRMAQPDRATEKHFPVLLLAMCLLSPLLWEHHWVWAALPCTLLVSASIEEGRGFAACVGACLIFFVPTFDAFPFSYHRLAGLLLVMADASLGSCVLASRRTAQP